MFICTGLIVVVIITMQMVITSAYKTKNKLEAEYKEPEVVVEHE